MFLATEWYINWMLTGIQIGLSDGRMGGKENEGKE